MSDPAAGFTVAGNDGLTTGLAAVDDDDGFGATVALKRPAQEAFGSHQAAMFAEEELQGVTDAVDSR